MSGHSKWSTIKRQKAVTDQKRAQVFTKFAAAISLAAKEGGSDLETNFKLRLAIDRARAMNMPYDNITRAIERATKPSAGNELAEVLYEVYGPASSAFLVTCVTDNKNRALSEIRQVINEFQGRLAESGSVLWQFEQKGILVIPKEKLPITEEQLQMLAIDAGASDIKTYPESVEIIVEPKDLKNCRDALMAKKIAPLESGLTYLPKNDLAIPDSKNLTQIKTFFDALSDLPDVQEVYTNVNLD